MDNKGLVNGAKIVGMILLIIIGVYASAIIGSLVIGSIGEVALSGDVAVPDTINTSINTTVTGWGTTISSVLSPITTITALVVIVVLIAIFFGKGFKMGNTGRGGIN